MKLLSILSHELTNEQKKELKEKYNVKCIVILSEELMSYWSNIDPNSNIPNKNLFQIIDWILNSSSEGDYVFIQGEYGSVYYLVDFCFSTNRVPIYSSSKRRVLENKEGEKVYSKRIFEHVKFKKYIKYEERNYE
ncbi:hypothetical protein GOQ29_00795 [Clostridium sp. D2Q-14]|uniref:CRISPR-associated protein Csx20 n=1 Tax=Anaeromonas gelatinilytica TaxID=2683194 RepID=UPI00193BB58D|nr:CRISPR-associated protein Csx20 [Anaeromonas gelatinilytica]MBS4534149.1 hypothetical protein [Anaeromonas gelatinilytica]